MPRQTREKAPVKTPAGLQEAEQIMAEYAIADAKVNEITAKMDQQITAIREKYADELQGYDKTRKDSFERLQLFAEQNDSMFGKKKSLNMSHGVVGFRTGTPKLKTLKKFTWAAVTTMLKEFMPTYVRTVDEPAKDKLLADRDKPEVLALFPKVGVEVVQDETFYVELKKEETAKAA
ncbi:hypothetical protein BH09BAC1_BH09BAC1_14360 [soil metagenome]